MSNIELVASPELPAIASYLAGLAGSRDASTRSMSSAIPLSVVRHGCGPLAGLMRGNQLYPVYQPIVSLRDGSIYSHEALIRGPQGTEFHTPDVLLALAAKEGLNYEFENFCVVAALGRWGTLLESGRLFVNLSGEVLVQALSQNGSDALMDMISSVGVLSRMPVIEITEHERVTDMDLFVNAVADLRAAGVSLALDDFGDGRSSLRLWSHLKPEIVKIDKYFTQDLSHHADKLKTIQAIQQIALIFDTALVAEGIETEDDLRILRDLGIDYGQGYLLGRPAARPREQIEPLAMKVMQDHRVAVFPEMARASSGGTLNRLAVIEAPAIGVSTSNDDLAKLFLEQPKLQSVALVEGTRPTGIINRSRFMNEYSKLYYREVWGRKSCLVHANLEPRIIERNHNVDELIGILTSDDQRYLNDGFIVTENGRYLGMGAGDQLVRAVTETRIEAARHANPLTFLPGNIPISQHIDRLLNSGVDFVACYADLNNFKPFNDQYGYWRGDEMIRLVARLALAHCDPRRDFVGHVGGDDFIILYQSADWQLQCERFIAEFADRAVELFDAAARAAGGIQAEDRYGVPRFFPLTTIAIGAVKISRDEYSNAEQVASVAARAKHDAKTHGVGLLVRDSVDFSCR